MTGSQEITLLKRLVLVRMVEPALDLQAALEGQVADTQKLAIFL